MRHRLTLPLLVLALAVPSARAQSGCVNSPENPTAVLVLVGAASAWIMHRRQR